jgi:hypothetical protein
MKIETHGPLKLSVLDRGSCVRIDVARVRSAEDLMDPLQLRAVSAFILKSGCPNAILNLGAAGVVSTQMLEWLARKWLPSASAFGLQRLSVVTATEAYKMLSGIFDECSRQVRYPQALRFFTSAQLKSGSKVFEWFSESIAPGESGSALELAVHAYGGVPFICVDFPYISTVEEYKRALFDEQILGFIRANQGNNLLLNFTASTSFGDELPSWIRETWLEIVASTGVQRVLIALPARIHGHFAKVLKPASFKKAGSSTHVKYCGETEVFDTGEALGWFKEDQAA